AQLLVRQWEDREKYTHSEPQMVPGALIEQKLSDWQASLDAPITDAPAVEDVMIESTAVPSPTASHADTPGL
ncbi:MAG: hypothetical protein ACRESW_10815, partial [Nevskiales bacterium]